MNPLRIMLTVFAVMFAASPRAEIYELPPEGYDVVGAVATVLAREEDTLIDIARRNGLGYHDIVHANPDVNVWVPGEGTEVVLPTRFVLPPGPRRGIVLNLAEYRLYYYPKPVEGEPAYVMTYPISIGRMDWETPLGSTSVISKVTNPSWYPPQSVRDEHAADGRPLPRIVPPGPDNPLGKYAMRLGLPGYLIHSTNRPAGVGMRVTHGCIRMFPEDIEYLFPNVDLNTTVRIINAPVKIGWFGDELVMEVHPVLEAIVSEGNEELVAADIDVDTGDGVTDENESPVPAKDPLTYVTEQFIAVTGTRAGALDWDEVETLIDRSDGIPAAAGTRIKNAAASAASQ
ncbi:MAG TPA: L,D-transpeptidase family protein [Woeseiaceae bacterium]|nr:L,D-transpeptidase family protein [Woeseiaceae bacterium]